MNPTLSTEWVRPPSLRDEIVRCLQRDIISGVLPPGQRLVERDIAERFHVSSIPVREALQELEARGLVVRRPNRGCSVVELSPEEVEQISALRRLVEPQVVRWAAERMTAESKKLLRAQMERLTAAVEQGDLADFFLQDLTLHKLIWKSSGNPYAVKALEDLVGPLFASGLIRRGLQINLRLELQKHERMIALLEEGEGEKAAMLLLEIAEGFERTSGGKA